MNQNLKFGMFSGIAASVGLVIGIILAGIFGSSVSSVQGGVNFEMEKFVKGFAIGSPAVQMMDGNGDWVGPLDLTGAMTATGAFQLDRIRFGGAITRIAATSSNITLTAAQVCDSSIIEITPLTSGASTTLPTSVALQADCLAREGDWKPLWIRNRATATTTILAAGASTTVQYASSTGVGSLLPGSDTFLINFIFATSSTGNAGMVEANVEYFK